MKKKFLVLSGAAVFLFAMVVNIQYAKNGYGVKNGNSIYAAVLAAVSESSSSDDPNDPRVYFYTNTFDKSGTRTDEYGVKWCWTWKGDKCDKKGDNCPNGRTDTYTEKKMQLVIVFMGY